jgi:hypothetical protein
MQITDAHIHVQPFHMMPPPVAATFWKGKPNRAELQSYAADPRALLARMDEDGIDRVGLINYVSPDVMGFTDEANPWMIRYDSDDPARLIPFGSSIHASRTTSGAPPGDRRRRGSGISRIRSFAPTPIGTRCRASPTSIASPRTPAFP